MVITDGTGVTATTGTGSVKSSGVSGEAVVTVPRGRWGADESLCRDRRAP
jgi:hypothetical protein